MLGHDSVRAVRMQSQCSVPTSTRPPRSGCPLGHRLGAGSAQRLRVRRNHKARSYERKRQRPRLARSGALRGGQSVVEYQGAHIPAEWELLLGGLVGCSPGGSADLGIARALVNGYVSRGDRCEPEHRCGQAASDQGGKSELLHFDAFFDLCCGAVRGRRTRTFFVGPVCTAFDRSDSSNAVVRALIPVAEIDRQLAGISHFNGRRFAGRQATAQSGRATLRQTGCSDGVVRYCCAVWCSRMRRTVV